jgi:hypothetical protein
MAEHDGVFHLRETEPVRPPTELADFVSTTLDTINELAMTEGARLAYANTDPNAVDRWQTVAGTLIEAAAKAQATAERIHLFATPRQEETVIVPPEVLSQRIAQLHHLKLAHSILPGAILNQGIRMDTVVPPVLVRDDYSISVHNNEMHFTPDGAPLYVFNALLALPRTPIKAVDIRSCGYDRYFMAANPTHHLSRNIKPVVDFLRDSGGIMISKGRGSAVEYIIHPEAYVEDLRVASS